MSEHAEGADLHPRHFRWAVEDRVATITLDRPERTNALTFEAYRELISTFRAMLNMDDVKAVILTGAGGNFSSGADVDQVLGPLAELRDDGDLDALLSFTRMAGSLVAAMRDCPQPIIAAIDGVCTGTGATLAMASDLRYGTPESRIAFSFARFGLTGAHMGACSMLPRIVGLGRATDLLYTGRFMDAEEAERAGFYNRVIHSGAVLDEALAMAHALAAGPTFAHALTKRCLRHEWAMPPDGALALDAEAQALCMQTADFARAYAAFVARRAPIFEGD